MAAPSPPRRLAARPAWRFALLPALAVAVLTCVLLALQHRLLGQELVERSLVRNQQRADVLGLQLQLALRDAVSQVRILARSPLLRPGAPLSRARAELDHLVARSPRFVWVGLVTPDGQVLAGSRGWLEGGSLAERPVFRRGIDGMVGDLHEAVLLAPLMARLPGGASELIDIGEPVLNDAGEVVAVVTAHLGLGWVREQLALGLGEPDAAAAQGLRGLVVTEPGTRSVVPGTTLPADLPAAGAPAQAWASDQQSGAQRWLVAQSALRGISGGEAPILPWRAIVLQSEDAALAPLRALTRTMLWAGVATALVLAAAGYWAARRLLTPRAPRFDADLTRGSAPAQVRVTERAAPAATASGLGTLADAALDTLLATLDADGRVLAWSGGAQALSGHPPADAVGRRLDELLPGAQHAAAWLRQAQVEGRCEIALQGPERRFEGAIYALGPAPGAARFGLMLRDVSARAAQARLMASARDEIAQLNHRLLEQEKQTSRKLARSLHDELGQTLAALRLHWEAYRSAAGEQRDRLSERIADLVAQANRQVRSVLAELRPPLLDELGLAAAIDNEIRQHDAAASGVQVTLLASEEAQLQRWPADIEYAVFMVAREALHNALHHANARQITVRLEGDEGLLEMRVEDDGDGFTPLAETAPGQPAQLGLVGMRERALAVGAELQIDGGPGRGTMVVLTWESAEALDDEPHLFG
ncbi:ATP-binding protein [Roseateles sp.]|uniref:ATP-binding protein n=1 Tax=Roseateles sp. TaxID=1971397 RepID=UPI003BABE156